jgi:uncharacterized membrane protein HdeD (DUF308 family)
MISEVPALGKNWWLFVVLGAVCFATGIAAIVWPGLTLLTLGLLAGIYLLIAAVMEIIEAITEPEGRAMSAILGVLALIAGLVCIRRPGESLLAIVIVLGVYLIAEGVFRIVLAFGSDGRRWWGIALGALDVIVGIIIMAWPEIGLVTLAVFFALTMLFRGIFAIVVGFKLRSLHNASEDAPVQQTATFA